MTLQTVSPNGIEQQPISTVVWIHRELLRANDYNPNHVATPELKLLAQSILEDGWTQPVVVREAAEEDDGTKYEIIDGFHRWTVSGRFAPVAAMTDGRVPCVIVDLDAAHQRMSTIRHNRARGKHAVVKMADIIDQLLAEGLSAKDMQERLGMEEEEVNRLAQRGKMVERGGSETFGDSWRPTLKGDDNDE